MKSKKYKFFILPYHDRDHRRVMNLSDIRKIIDGLMYEYKKENIQNILVSVHSKMNYGLKIRLENIYEIVNVECERNVDRTMYALNKGYIICVDKPEMDMDNLLDIHKYIIK